MTVIGVDIGNEIAPFVDAYGEKTIIGEDLRGFVAKAKALKETEKKAQEIVQNFLKNPSSVQHPEVLWAHIELMSAAIRMNQVRAKLDSDLSHIARFGVAFGEVGMRRFGVEDQKTFLQLTNTVHLLRRPTDQSLALKVDLIRRLLELQS